MAAAGAGAPRPAADHKLLRLWFAFGFLPVFATVVAIFWLMMARPQFSF